MKIKPWFIFVGGLMFGVAAFFIILVVRATVLLIKEKVTINKQRASYNSSTDSSVEAEN